MQGRERSRPFYTLWYNSLAQLRIGGNMKKLLMISVSLLVFLTAVNVFAAQMRVFVNEISAPGVKNGKEMRQMLQTLLASRLNGDRIITVESAADAEILVSGSYIALGKSYSLDVIAKTSAGKVLTRAFIQGEKDGEIIPAMGTLAEKLTAGLIKIHPAERPPVVTPHPSSSSIKAVVAADSTQNGGFINPVAKKTDTTDDWLSRRLNGKANLMATGKTLPDGSRELFLAEERRIAYYHQGAEMTLLSEAELGYGYKIISLDTMDAENGTLDIYVTAVQTGELASQVWQVRGGKLVQLQKALPYFFRAARLADGTKKLYAQTMGREDDFYGNVYEVTRSDALVTMKNPLKMPRYGNIYNFNQFRERDGRIFTIVINPDNYLVVYDQDLKELWRSKKKFGGSDLYFLRDDTANMRETGSSYRWIFMNQRIQVSSSGEILVGNNEGSWVIGNSRSYENGAVYCLFWNGSSLDEKWHTQKTQNYMADYFFDEADKELLILLTLQQPNLTNHGASSLRIKKLEN